MSCDIFRGVNSALDSFTNEEISAARFKPSHHFLRLICPQCDAPVSFVARSDYHCAYFKHRSNQADPNCPLFHAGADSAAYLKQRARLERVPRLRLEVTSGRGKIVWQLMFVVPPIPETFSAFSISGCANPGRFPATGVRVKSRNYPIDPSEDEYILQLFPSGGASEERKVAGLSRSAANVFTGGARGGLLLRTEAQLVTGEGYHVLSRAQLPQAPQGIQAKLLSISDGWFHFVVVFPRNIEEPVRKWCIDALGRNLQARRVTWYLLQPEDASLLPDGGWSVPLGRRVVAGVTISSSRVKRLQLFSEDGTIHREISAASADFIAIEIEPLPEGFYEFRCTSATDNDPVGPSLYLLAEPPQRRPFTSIAITLESSDQTSEVASHALWDEEMPRILSSLKNGRVLKTVSVPTGVEQPLVNIVDRLGRCVRKIESGSDAAAAIQSGATEALRKGNGLSISADSFGNVVVGSFAGTPPQQRRSLTAKDEWVALMSQSLNSMPPFARARLGAALEIHRRKLPDLTLC
jgi:hypothetical protein